MIISGTFEVNLSPQAFSCKGQNGIDLNRMSIDKTFSGDLAATSKGEMLSALTPTQGSAGYVAIEQVSGSLKGRQGSFVLQHYGLMNKGAQSLTLEVVPDSGTDGLSGLTGSMTITMDDGQHYYNFEYSLPGESEWV